MWEQLTILEVPLARSIEAASMPVATSKFNRNLTNISDDHDALILLMPPSQHSKVPPSQHSKVPPVKSFTVEDSSIHWDDWLPTLERAATWK